MSAPLQPPREAIVLLLQTVASEFEVAIEDIRGPARSKDLVVPRQVAAYLLHEKYGMSSPRIGHILGGRHHTSVLYSLNQTRTRLHADAEFNRLITELLSRLGADIEHARKVKAIEKSHVLRGIARLETSQAEILNEIQRLVEGFPAIGPRIIEVVQGALDKHDA